MVGAGGRKLDNVDALGPELPEFDLEAIVIIRIGCPRLSQHHDARAAPTCEADE
jgi:hypothetical protein